MFNVRYTGKAIYNIQDAVTFYKDIFERTHHEHSPLAASEASKASTGIFWGFCQKHNLQYLCSIFVPRLGMLASLNVKWLGEKHL